MITMTRERRSRAAKQAAVRRKAMSPDWMQYQYYDGMYRSVYGCRIAPRWHVERRARGRVS